MRYSVKPKNRISVKCYRFLAFAKNKAENLNRNLSDKNSKNCLDYVRNLQQIWLKLLQKKIIRKLAKVSGDLIDNKIADKNTSTASQSNPETDTQTFENSIEIPKEI